MTLQISPDATDVYPDATTATIFLKKSLLSVNCFAYKAVPSLADDEKQDNHLWHLAQVMHRSASHPFSVHQAGQTHRNLAWRQTMAWDKLWCNSTQKKLSVQSPENRGLWRFLNLWWSQAQLANPPFETIAPLVLTIRPLKIIELACNLFMRTSKSCPSNCPGNRKGLKMYILRKRK